MLHVVAHRLYLALEVRDLVVQARRVGIANLDDGEVLAVHQRRTEKIAANSSSRRCMDAT